MEFLKWLSGNPACTQTFKNKMLQLFDLKEFTCSDLTTFVRESMLYSPKKISDVLDEKAVSFESSNKEMKKQIKNMKCDYSRDKQFLEWLEQDHGSSWIEEERKRWTEYRWEQRSLHEKRWLEAILNQKCSLNENY